MDIRDLLILVLSLSNAGAFIWVLVLGERRQQMERYIRRIERSRP